MIYAAEVAERGDYSCPDRFCADGFTFRKFETDETWGGADRHFWFRAEVPEKIAGERAIYDALCLLDLRDTGSAAFRNSVELADKSLRENYYDSRKEAPVTVHSIGYTHIDVAWKWPIRQTRQKAVRSYQTVLNLMKEYPEYRFSASTPELYEFVREDAPDLFEEIRKKIQEDRWEAEGGMWLEPDCNLISGESMVRQFLYGTRYFEEVLHAGKQEVLFLPEWDGELYLEYHRGTYTSRAETKRNNRKAEIGMQQTEFLSVLALLAGNGFAYPKAQLDQSWLLLLRNQFHDILPGSSIHEVYEQSDREYAQIMESNEKLNAAALAAVLNEPLLCREFPRLPRQDG